MSFVAASAILHERAGSPEVDGCAELPDGERCWVCAGIAKRGKPREKWMGSNFVGQNRVRSPQSAHVCEPCIWAMGGRGTEAMRMWTHLYDAGEYVRVNKAHKPQIREFLRKPKRGPWFAAIADSGQKQILPWVPVNPPGCKRGRVLMDETFVALPDDSGWQLVDDMTQLLTDGATKAGVERGEYGPGEWARCPEAIRAFEDKWGHLRGGAWFGLALWLAQRDEEAVAERMEREKAERKAKAEAEKERKRSGKARRSGKGKAANADGGGASRRARGVSKDAGLQRPETLGPATGQDASGGKDERKPGRVGDGNVPHVANRSAKPGQLSLFG